MPRERELDPTQDPLAFFGAEVRRVRTAAGMSLADLGQLVPCDKSTVSRIESGLLTPDEAFARACDRRFPEMGEWFTRFRAAHAHRAGGESPTWDGPDFIGAYASGRSDVSERADDLLFTEGPAEGSADR